MKRNQWIPDSERWCTTCGARFHADDLPAGADDSPPQQDADGQAVANPAHQCTACQAAAFVAAEEELRRKLYRARWPK